MGKHKRNGHDSPYEPEEAGGCLQCQAARASEMEGCGETTQMLHPGQEKQPEGSSAAAAEQLRRCGCCLGRKGDPERFAGETCLLKGALLVLGICFAVSTTAFIITACVVGLDEDGYDRWAANHSKFYVAAEPGTAEELAVQRLEDIYLNLTGNR